MAMKFRKKSPEAEAMLWTGDNTRDIAEWVAGHAGKKLAPFELPEGMYLKRTKEGAPFTLALPKCLDDVGLGDWIIRDQHGIYFAVDPIVFQRLYEPAE